METLKACVATVGFLIAIMFPACCSKAQALPWEYREIRILETDGSEFTIPFFVESEQGELGDPDLGQHTATKPTKNGVLVRFHDLNEVYLRAAGVFGSPRGEREGEDDFILRVERSGCRIELESEGTIYVARRVCDHHKQRAALAPVRLLELARRGYRYPRPIRHKGPRTPRLAPMPEQFEISAPVVA